MLGGDKINFITIIWGGGKPHPQTSPPDQRHNHPTIRLLYVQLPVTVSLAFMFWGYGTVSVDTSINLIIEYFINRLILAALAFTTDR